MTGGAGSGRDPFAVLGLRADDDLGDDDVRTAWRRIAEATHPDRADGGDPERFALAAAAYTDLRTAFGRNEARADLANPAGAGRTSAGRISAGRADSGPAPRTRGVGWAGITSRIRNGRPGRLLLRLASATFAASVGVIAAGPGSPAAPALAAGALTWLLVTARHDLSA